MIIILINHGTLPKQGDYIHRTSDIKKDKQTDGRSDATIISLLCYSYAVDK